MDSQPTGAAAERRISETLPAGTREALETGLPPTDLQTLLLAVTRVRAARVTPAQVVRRWREDRFVQPSPTDPRRLAEVEARLWRLLPRRFTGVELSPLVPLGTCSSAGPVDQHRVVSTVRGTEVVSDPTNALAVEAAVRRARHERVDLAACHRVVRAQRFPAGYLNHFKLFCLVSSARDSGSGRTEAGLLVEHAGFWQRAMAEMLPGRSTRVTVTVFDHPVLGERLRDTIRPALAGTPVPLVDDPSRTHGAGYYTGAAIGVRAEVDGEDIDLGDGGLTDCTAKLRSDRKERCMTSCVSTERLAALLD